MNTVMEKHIVAAENAEKMAGWIKDRGGIAVWRSINISNLGISWTTPAVNVDGSPSARPSWQADSKPERIITDPTEVLVSVDKEVKRFRVGVRLGSQGMSYKVTDGGSRRIRAAVAKAGEGAYHVFDYETQEAVIMAPVETIPLTEFIGRKSRPGV
jgi:ribosomal protein S6